MAFRRSGGLGIVVETRPQGEARMPFQFHHIHLRSPDPDATAAFYRTMFAAEITRSVYPAGSQYAGLPKLGMVVGGQRILIHPTPPSGPVGAAPQAPYYG